MAPEGCGQRAGTKGRGDDDEDGRCGGEWPRWWVMSAVLLALLCVGGSILFAAVGVLIGRKIVRHHVAEGHNDVVVPVFATAGVIYAVLLGFMVIAEWESYHAAHINTGEEAAILVPLYRQTAVMPDEQGRAMRHLIREYAEHVVQGWERFQNGERNIRAGHDLNEVYRIFGTLNPPSKAAELVAADFLQNFSKMIFYRNKRYVQARESLSWIMWLGAIGGGVITVGLTFILFMERWWPHMVVSCVMSGLIGLLLFILALVSRPFVGPLAIHPEPFEQVLSVFDDVDKGN